MDADDKNAGRGKSLNLRSQVSTKNGNSISSTLAFKKGELPNAAMVFNIIPKVPISHGRMLRYQVTKRREATCTRFVGYLDRFDVVGTYLMGIGSQAPGLS